MEILKIIGAGFYTMIIVTESILAPVLMNWIENKTGLEGYYFSGAKLLILLVMIGQLILCIYLWLRALNVKF